MLIDGKLTQPVYIMRGSRGGGGRVRTPLEFAKLNSTILLEMKKISYFSYLCTSTVICQTESIHKITIK